MAEANVSDLVLIIIAFFLPPVTAVFTDGCGGQFCLNVLLTILGFIPGLIHAVWLVYRQSKRREALGPGQNTQGRPGHYVAVQQPQQHQPHYHQQQPAQQQYQQQYPPAPEPVPGPAGYGQGYHHGKVQ